MPPVCSLCRHAEREAIDAALVEGRDSLRDIAGRYGTSKSAVERHRDHVPQRLALAREAEETTKADDLLDILREGVADARRLRDKAEGDRDFRGAIVCVRTLADLVEKLVSVAERLAEAEAAKADDLLASAEWAGIKQCLLDALMPFPEALKAAGEALREIGEKGFRPAPIRVTLKLPPIPQPPA